MRQKQAIVGADILASSALSAAARHPSSPLVPYYSTLSNYGFRSGFGAERGAQELLPKMRWALGGAYPTLTGVADYEFGRMLGKNTDTHLTSALKEYPLALEHIQRQPNVLSSAQTMVKDWGADPNVRKQLSTVLDKPEAALVNSPHWKEFKSPLARHAALGISGGQPESPFAAWLAKRFSGPAAKQILPGTAISSALTALGGLTGGVPGAVFGALSSAPSAFVSAAANLGGTHALENIKAKLVQSGLLEAEGYRGAGRRLVNSALSVIDPVSREFIDLGKDLSTFPAGVKAFGSNADNLVRQGINAVKEQAQRPAATALLADARILGQRAATIGGRATGALSSAIRLLTRR